MGNELMKIEELETAANKIRELKTCESQAGGKKGAEIHTYFFSR